MHSKEKKQSVLSDGDMPSDAYSDSCNDSLDSNVQTTIELPKTVQFFDFYRKNYEAFKISHPELKLNEIRSAMGELWDTLKPSEKAKYGELRLKSDLQQKDLVNCSCKSSSLLRVNARLNDKQKKAVRAVGFGSFLEMKMIQM